MSPAQHTWGGAAGRAASGVGAGDGEGEPKAWLPRSKWGACRLLSTLEGWQAQLLQVRRGSAMQGSWWGGQLVAGGRSWERGHGGQALEG